PDEDRMLARGAGAAVRADRRYTFAPIASSRGRVFVGARRLVLSFACGGSLTGEVAPCRLDVARYGPRDAPGPMPPGLLGARWPVSWPFGIKKDGVGRDKGKPIALLAA